MIGRSYLASRRVAILPKAAELASRYCLGTSVCRNGSLCVLRPVATFASRLRNVPAGSEYVYRPIRCVSASTQRERLFETFLELELPLVPKLPLVVWHTIQSNIPKAVCK